MRNLILIITASIILNTKAPIDSIQPKLNEGHATAYCLQGTMANGDKVHSGVCAMSDKRMLGKTVIVYQRLADGSVGKQIGIYEVCDTGCKSSVIDVWMPDIEQCQEFMNLVYEDGCRGKIFYQIVEAEG